MRLQTAHTTPHILPCPESRYILFFFAVRIRPQEVQISEFYANTNGQPRLHIDSVAADVDEAILEEKHAARQMTLSQNHDSQKKTHELVILAADSLLGAFGSNGNNLAPRGNEAVGP